MSDTNIFPNDWTSEHSIIRVIGVGGGGCNAVTYMYNQQIQGCSFIVCNTDQQALRKSNVPTQIQLGAGLGAGTNPTKGRNAALDSQELIEKVALDNGTQMLFITAGMGGGTGTGAAPVIAKMAKDRGILTVAIVTLPFLSEGNKALAKASDGIHELEKNVDSLLIINNEKLYDIYGDLLVQDAFPRSNEVLAIAVRGILEIITDAGYINADFEDVKTMMKGSGMAMMGCGSGKGANRLEDAVNEALTSPLLNDPDLSTTKNLLINVTVGRNEKGVLMKEMKSIDSMIHERMPKVINSKKAITMEEDPEFGDTVKITAIATGFRMSLVNNIVEPDQGNLIMIDKDFVYDPSSASLDGKEVELPDEEVGITKVGYNTMENVRKFHFAQGEKPVMILDASSNISGIEKETAIRRTTHKPKTESEL